jgi:hypothetical protein
MLGWIIDTISETVKLPEHRRKRLIQLLTELSTTRRLSLRAWQKALGELRSMVLALPGGRGLFSTLYTGLSQSTPVPTHRVQLTRPLQDAISDLLYIAKDLGSRPICIGELVDTVPVAYGAANACATGMGSVWLSPDPNFPPTIWRHVFPVAIQRQLVSQANPHGKISNSESIIPQLWDCREATIATFTDNIATRAWHRKGSRTTLGPSAYLLHINALHQRFHRYRANINYIQEPANTMADDASRHWDLTDSELLTHFNSCYPQTVPWQLSTLQPAIKSSLISALQCTRADPASWQTEPNTVMLPGFNGPTIVRNSQWSQHSPLWPTPFPSSKSLPNVTAMVPLRPVASLPSLAQWKQPSVQLRRQYPFWGPQTHTSPYKDTSTTACSNN